MALNSTNLILILLGGVLVLCFVLMLIQNKNEGFAVTIPNTNNDPVISAIQSKLATQTPEQLKKTIQTLQQRLIDYGYAPDLSTYVKKTELGDSGKCIVSVADDRDKYISKTDVPPPGPRIDLSQYVKKSSIPPAPVCPPTPTIDLSAYVKKSTLPPTEKCPPCIAPKVKVSAGLCRECPPPPPCPAPAPCPSCNCPPPAPCPAQKECTKCDEIRYIKVPAVITKTITVDQNGRLLSQQIDSGSTTPTGAVTTTTQALTPSTTTAATSTTTPQVTSATTIAAALNPMSTPVATIGSSKQSSGSSSGTGSSDSSFFSSFFKDKQSVQSMPSTTFPAMASNAPNTALAQTLDSNKSSGSSNPYCASSDLNTPFREYNGGRIRGRNESNFPY
jgi:hypothetical protein